MRSLVCLCALSLLWLSSAQRSTIRLGALLNAEKDTVREAAIRLAIDDINNDPDILTNYTVELLVGDTTADSIRGLLAVREMIEKEVSIVVGPMSSSMSAAALPLAGFFHIPLVSPTATAPTLVRYKAFFRLVPSDVFQVKVILDMCQHFKWERLVILHTNDGYGEGIQTAFESLAPSYKISPLGYAVGDRPVEELVEILEGIYVREDAAVFILAVSKDMLPAILRAAEQSRVLDRGTAWIGTDTILDIVPDPDFLNATGGFLAVIPSIANGTDTRATLADRLNVSEADRSRVDNYVAHSYDAAMFAAKGVDEALKRFDDELPPFTEPTSTDPATWMVNPLGEVLLDALRDVHMEGLTGPIHLGSDKEAEGRYVVLNNRWDQGKWIEAAEWKNGTWNFDRGERNRTYQPVWPGRSVTVPKDCVLCGARCHVCDEDRLSVIEFYFDLLSHNNATGLLERWTGWRLNVSSPFCSMWAAILCERDAYYIIMQGAEGLGGPLPKSMGKLKHCQGLVLARNRFDGPIPSLEPNLCPSKGSGRESKLKMLLLEQNMLVGELPESLGNCGALTDFNIEGNRIQGELPDTICNLTSIVEFRLERNLFSGPLPPCIGGGWGRDGNYYPGMRNLTYLFLSYNMFSGLIPQSIGGLKMASTIFLHRNQFAGPLPDVFDDVPLTNSITLIENPNLQPGIPASLARHMREEPLRIKIDPRMFGCRLGYQPPSEDYWHRFEIDNATWRSMDVCSPCPPGHFRVDGIDFCLPCVAGKAAPRMGMGQCDVCPEGTFSREGAVVCLRCTPGTYAATSASQYCSACVEGTVAEVSGAATCRLCPVGANCSLPRQRADPDALPGFYRFDNLYRQRREDKFDNMTDEEVEALVNRLGYAWLQGTMFRLYDGFDPVAQSSNAYTFVQCPNDARCMGANTCGEGSLGPLCADCSRGYAPPTGGGECQECPSPIWSWSKIVLFPVVALTIIAFLVRSTLREGLETLSLQAVIVKIVQTWLEMCGPAVGMAMENVNLDVFRQLTEGVGYLDSLTNPLKNFIGIECLLRTFPAIHFYALLAFLFPPVAVLLAYGFYAGKVYFDRKRHGLPLTPDAERGVDRTNSIDPCTEQPVHVPNRRISRMPSTGIGENDNIYVGRMKRFLEGKDDAEALPWLTEVHRKATSCVVVCVVLFHPIMTKCFINNLDCVVLDGPRVRSHPSIECTGHHFQYWFTLSLVGMVLWTAGLPIAMYLILRQHRHRLHEESVMARFGFLFAGYEPDFYWWESWAMFRRIIVDLPPAIPFLGAEHEMIVLLLLAVISLFLNAAFQPYDNRAFKICDHLESQALWAFLLTLLCIPVLENLRVEEELVDTGAVAEAGAEYAVVVFVVCLHVFFVFRAALWFLRPYFQKAEKRYHAQRERELNNEMPRRKAWSCPRRRVPKLIRRLTMLDQARILLRPGKGGELLDISQLSEAERNFLRECFNEAIIPQLHRHVAYFDVFFVHETLVRVFRRKALQNKLAEAREMIRQVDPNLLLSGTQQESPGVRVLRHLVNLRRRIQKLAPGSHNSFSHTSSKALSSSPSVATSPSQNAPSISRTFESQATLDVPEDEHQPQPGAGAKRLRKVVNAVGAFRSPSPRSRSPDATPPHQLDRSASDSDVVNATEPPALLPKGHSFLASVKENEVLAADQQQQEQDTTLPAEQVERSVSEGHVLPGGSEGDVTPPPQTARSAGASRRFETKTTLSMASDIGRRMSSPRAGTSGDDEGTAGSGGNAGMGVLRRIASKLRTFSSQSSDHDRHTIDGDDNDIHMHPIARWRRAIQKVRLIIGIRKAFDGLARDARMDALQLGMTVEDLHVALLDQRLITRVLQRQDSVHTEILRQSEILQLDLEDLIRKRQKTKRSKSRLRLAMLIVSKRLEIIQSYFAPFCPCLKRAPRAPLHSSTAGSTVDGNGDGAAGDGKEKESDGEAVRTPGGTISTQPTEVLGPVSKELLEMASREHSSVHQSPEGDDAHNHNHNHVPGPGQAVVQRGEMAMAGGVDRQSTTGSCASKKSVRFSEDTDT
ncbi:unnamed protein product [Vitrella brassicaformis CCMP3155]|uniref:Uncharacterized protein n=4 Tax=Vitrella brassicaformis TaxID=1169539 RepID=A0A0G4GJQ7_VITBC|nr:unnamed protein product [Vitrella brassicaformis CCMP3155]|eukprot:CEM30150.1 unnamed protein product [Vitrella brassicaformis CCMP3155]